MLKVSYDSKDQVPEKFAELYTEQGGKYVLSGVEGMKTQADVDNVQEALRKERELKKAAEAKLTAFEGIESEGLRESLDELEKLRTTGGKVDDSKIEDIVSQRMKLEKAKFEREMEKLTEKMTSVEELNKNLVNEKNTSLIERQLREASNGKVNDTAMGDVLFRKSIFEVTEGDEVLTKEGVDGVRPGLKPTEWLDETLKTNTHWQKQSKGVGASGSKVGGSHHTKGERSSYADIMSESGVEFN